MSHQVLTRTQFDSLDLARPTRVEPVPELGNGAHVRLQGLTAGELGPYIAFASSDAAKANPAQVPARLLVLAIVDETGARLFGDGDEGVVLRMAFPVVERLALVASELSGLNVDAAKNASGPSRSGA